MFKALVVGAGRAGQARVRAIQQVSGVDLFDHVSFHKGLTMNTLTETLSNPEINMVFLCGVNETHYSLGKLCLQHQKHTSIEFPIAGSAGEAQELYRLAEARSVSLHSAPIGLLTENHEHLLDQAVELHGAKVSLSFQGGFYSWIKDEAQKGHLGQLAVGRLHTLWSLFGPLELQNAERRKAERGYSFRVVMSGARNNRIELAEKRAPELSRAYAWRGMTSKRGNRRPLFQIDTQKWCDSILGKSDIYVRPQTQIQVMDLAERISALLAKVDS